MSSSSRSSPASTPAVPAMAALGQNLDQPRIQTSGTWPMDEPSTSPKVPAGSPGYRFRNRRLISTLVSPRVRAKSTPRSQPPSLVSPSFKPPTLSPSLRAAAIHVANGSGHSAVGFLKGCCMPPQDAAAQTNWSSSQRCLEQCQQALGQEAWASGEGMDLVEMSELAAFDAKDVVAPAFPASGYQRPSRLLTRRRASQVSRSIEECERCSCCTKEEFWVIYDVFVAMDRQQEGSLRRGDFVWALSAHGTSIEFQRVVRRSRLSAYFKSTARDICLQEFILRIFPNASTTDLLKMHRWVSLRKAWRIVTNPTFKPSHEEVKRVFTLLEEDCSGTVSANELVRAQILSRDEISPILPPSGELHMGDVVFDETLVHFFGKKPSVDGEDDKENNWEDSVIHDGLKEILEECKQEFRFPFGSGNEGSAEGHSSTTQAESNLVVAPPLPPGTVAALIAHLSEAVSPKSARKAGTAASPNGVSVAPWRHSRASLCEMENSPAISAF